MSDIVGKTLTYKQMCEELNLPRCTGNTKIAQLKDLERYYKWEKEGTKYTIIKKYQTPLPIIDERCNEVYNTQLDIKKEYQNKGGIYKIQLGNDVYIGQTNGFAQRIRHHYHNVNSKAYEMLHNGAKMTILEIEDDREQRFIKEVEYVYKFLEEGYNVVNSFNVLYRQDNQKKQKKSEYTMLRINKNQYDEVYELLKNKGYDILPLRKE